MLLLCKTNPKMTSRSRCYFIDKLQTIVKCLQSSMSTNLNPFQIKTADDKPHIHCHLFRWINSFKDKTGSQLQIFELKEKVTFFTKERKPLATNDVVSRFFSLLRSMKGSFYTNFHHS